MSTCRWCTPGGQEATCFLKRYASGTLSAEEKEAANEDLSFCFECVVEYHGARDQLPSFHKILWKLETFRLINHLEKAMKGEPNQDDLYIVEDHQEIQISNVTGPDLENNLRIPLLEIMKYPYLLLHPQIGDLCVEAFHKIESDNSFQVFEKHAGIYLLLVHPDEIIRKWAIRTARSLGKVDRDDFYDLQDVVSCMFKVIELDLFVNSDIYNSDGMEEGKLILLPPHLYEANNYKNYWLGICMLLTVLDAQAMDTLLLGPDRQSNLMQSILNTMEKRPEDDDQDPFWPALQCFMVILDRLGSKVWAMLIDPNATFQTIIRSPSYNKEVEHLRRNTSGPRVKVEPEADDDMVTCSQIVYDTNTNKKSKQDAANRHPMGIENCIVMYEEMQSLVNVLQSDIGQDIRIHDSTFLWFFPFVRSVMDLNSLSVVYVGEIIHHLHTEIKDLLTGRLQHCDKVTEFFVLILVFVVELHRSKNCMNLLWYTSHCWIEVLVKCATVCSPAFSQPTDSSSRVSSTTSVHPQVIGVVPQACIQLIRSLLRDGCQLYQELSCKQYLDMLNRQMRRGFNQGWNLSPAQLQELQSCLMSLVKNMQNLVPSVKNVPPPEEPALNSKHENVRRESEQRHFECQDEQHGTPSDQQRGVHLKKEPPWDEGYCVRSCLEQTKPAKQNEKSCSLPGKAVNKDVESVSDSHASVQDRMNYLKSKLNSTDLLAKLSKVISPSQIKKERVEDCSVSEKRASSHDSTKEQKEKSLVGETVPRSIKQEPKWLPSKQQPLGDDDETRNSSDDDVPLTVLKSNLRKKVANVMDGEDTLTPSQVDKDLNFLSLAALTKSFNFPDTSSQESSMQCPNRVERKVKRMKKKLEADDVAVAGVSAVKDPVIVISDSSDEDAGLSEKEPEDNHSKANPEEVSEPSHGQAAEKTSEENLGLNSYDVSFECDSQFFEHETQEDIYSAWEKSDGNLKDSTGTGAPSPVPVEMYDNWGYDTDYVPDDQIEMVAAEAEEQLRCAEGLNQNTSSASSASVAITNKSEAKVSPLGESTHQRKLCGVKSAGVEVAAAATCAPDGYKKAQTLVQPEKPAKSTTCLSAETSKASKVSPRSIEKNSPSTSHLSEKMPPTASASAVVPTEKIRPQEDLCIAEKLCLKKKPRQGEVSQNSLSTIEELRRQGRDVQIANRSRRSRKSKGNRPQKSAGKGISKINPQYLQFLLQCRPKDLQKTSKMPPSAPAPPKQAIPCQSNSFVSKVSDVASPKLPPPKKAEPMSSDVKKASYKDIDFFPLSQLGPDSEDEDDNMKQAGTSAEDNPEQGVSCDQSLHPPLAGEKDQPGVENSKAAEDDDDDDDFMQNLTQLDPIDMEVCSQVETSDEFYVNQNIPAGQGSVSDLYGLRPSIKPANDQPAAVQTEGLAAVKPLVEAKEDEHVFLVPGLPISEQKALKPSTTKIYASTSRIATLAQELEKPTKTAGLKKIVRPLLPSRSSTALPAPARPQPVNVSQEREMRSNALPRVNIPPNPVLPIPRPVMHQNPDTPKATSLLPANLDPKFFIQEILKWSYEMFDNFTQFGAPDHLCKFPLKEVPDRFQSFEEYFCTFYPLLMMNTFEEMVQEWLRNSKPNKAYETNLTIKTVECPYKYYSGTFTATLNNSQVQRQLYPKEDDMVFLWLPQYLNPYTNDEREVESVPYVGCVSKSTVVTGQNDRSAILHVTIETCGNISVINDQLVKCKVIGSLVSAGRVFKALHSLRNGFMTKLLLTPQVTYFKPISQEPTSDWNFEDFNGEQIKAINSAFSMTRQPVRTPKICLIHGPPGTGKTKTIVGLLQLIFSKVHRNENFIANQRLKSKRPRVLLCAPSNAAVDHLMKKIILSFKNKCKDEGRPPLGNCGDINLVRLGVEKSIMRDLTAFSLDNQTKARIERANFEQDRAIDRHIQELDARLEKLSHMCAQFKKDNAKYQVFMDEKLRLFKDRERLGRQQKQNRMRKQEAQTRILQDAHVICCTLSTSGSILLEVAFRRLGQDPFTCVIVDEAGQATETETLIPLTYRCATLVLVGDPEQLPPTVVSQKAKERKYDQSLMARLWKCLHRDIKQNPSIPNPINFLTMQYRMHPDICLFPSNYIYNRALKTDGATAEQRCSIRWPFQPYCIFDVVDGRETKEGDSFVNHQEVKLVMELIKLVVGKQKGRVGVITHYSAQKNRIREILNIEKKNDPMKLLQCVEVDTVDGFQGQEKDCIIVSCVRASSSKGSIGFVGNKQRLNVTLTRAKQSLFILGHLKTLMDHRDWSALIQDAHKRGNIIRTREKDYKKDAVWIFKPEPGLTRSLSYPLSDSSRPQPKPPGSSPAPTSSNQGLVPPASSHSTAPISMAATVERRHTTETLTAVATQVLKSCLAFPSVRPTMPKETSKDPRLASRQRDTTKNQPSTEKGPAAANRTQSSSNPGKTLPVPARDDRRAPSARERHPRWEDQARPQKRPLDSREYDVSHKRQK